MEVLFNITYFLWLYSNAKNYPVWINNNNFTLKKFSRFFQILGSNSKVLEGRSAIRSDFRTENSKYRVTQKKTGTFGKPNKNWRNPNRGTVGQCCTNPGWLNWCLIQGDTKKRELLKNPTKIEEIQEKKFINRNLTTKTCLLRDSNPNYQCLKITSFRWRPPPRMHSFTATTHFKSSRSFVSPYVCCICSAECDSVAFCRACNTHRVTQKNGNFWNA